MSGHVPTANLTALYNNTTPGTTADPAALDNAVADIVSTVNSNYDFTAGLISAGTLSRLGVINVMDYRVTGDGTTDDTEALNNAFASIIANGGGEVIIPPGTYIISNAVTIPSNCKVTGTGIGQSVIKIKDSAGASQISAVMTEDGGSNIIISDLTIDGNRANQSWMPIGSANYGLGVRSSNTVVRNVETKNVTANGMGVPVTASSVIFDGCYSHGNGKKGFHSGIVEDIKIVNGFFYNNEFESGIGIHAGMQRGIIANNHCFNNGLYGINIGESDDGIETFDFVIVGNIIYDNDDSNILIEGRGNTVSTLSKTSVISGNFLRNGRLMCQASSRVQIKNNMLMNSWVYLQTCFNIDITDNMIFDPPAGALAGIKSQGTNLGATTLTIGDNIVIRDNTVDIGTNNIPYAIEVSNTTNVDILDNILRGTPATLMVRVWNNMETTKIRQPKNQVRSEAQLFDFGFDNYSILTASPTASRPPKAVRGQGFFDTTLGKPIWVKTSAVVDGSGAVTTPAVWVDATGTTV